MANVRRSAPIIGTQKTGDENATRKSVAQQRNTRLWAKRHYHIVLEIVLYKHRRHNTSVGFQGFAIYKIVFFRVRADLGQVRNNASSEG
jgi:hypothetical protein